MDRLLDIPAGLPASIRTARRQPHAGTAAGDDPLAADQLGLGDRVEVLDVEIHRHGKSYTADTLAALKARYPGR